MKKLLTPCATLPALCLLLLSCFVSCDDDFLEQHDAFEIIPSSNWAYDITYNSATLSGNISCDFWTSSQEPIPTELIDECYFMLFEGGNSTRIDVPVPSSFDEEITAQVTGLTPGIYYYSLCVRYGVLFAESRPSVFENSLDAPVLSDLQYTDLTATSVTLSGSVLDDGGRQLETLELYWRDSYNETEYNKVELSPDSYTFTYTISGLQPNTTCDFYARASNGSYSTDTDRLTLTTLPEFSEFAVTAVISNNVAFRVAVVMGSASLVRMGICYCVVNEGDTRLPTYENDSYQSIEPVSGVLTNPVIYGLQPLRTYCFRAYAANAGGMVYSAPITITIPNE